MKYGWENGNWDSHINLELAKDQSLCEEWTRGDLLQVPKETVKKLICLSLNLCECGEKSLPEN